MAIPPDASSWQQPIDPTDKVDFVVQFGDLFETGEVIDTFEVAALAEAAALGLTVLEDVDHGPFIANDTNIELWFEIDEAQRSNAAFDGSGSRLGVQVTVTTSATPARRFQRTAVLTVKHL